MWFIIEVVLWECWGDGLQVVYLLILTSSKELKVLHFSCWRGVNIWWLDGCFLFCESTLIFFIISIIWLLKYRIELNIYLFIKLFIELSICICPIIILLSFIIIYVGSWKYRGKDLINFFIFYHKYFILKRL